MVKIRKLESRVGKERFKYTWENFHGLTVVTVESEFPLSVSRIANSISPQGKRPHLMVLFKPQKNHYTIIPNRIKMDETSALKLIGGLAHELNQNDETAVYGGTRWMVDNEKVILHSQNHGFNSSLTLKEVITVIGIKQFFREIKRMRNIVLLPLPGQVGATQSMRMALEKTPGKMPFGGKIEVIKGNVKITLQGSL